MKDKQIETKRKSIVESLESNTQMLERATEMMKQGSTLASTQMAQSVMHNLSNVLLDAGMLFNGEAERVREEEPKLIWYEKDGVRRPGRLLLIVPDGAFPYIILNQQKYPEAVKEIWEAN